MPLRWKLVVLWTLALALVIAGFSAALLWALRTTLERGIEKELDARAAAVGALVEHESGTWVVESKPGIADAFASDGELYYAVADASGTALAASPLAEALGAVAGTTPGTRVWETTRGRRFFEVTRDVPRSGDEEAPIDPTEVLRVTCGADLHDADLAVASLRRALLILGPAVMLAALAGGLFLAGRVLLPIDRIARTAAAIGADDLDQRIEVRGRDELAALAGVLNDTFARLRASFQRQVSFTADAAHELRTPLAALAANVELALRRPRDAAEQRELLLEMQSATEQMRTLVESLLVLARADAGPASLPHAPVALAPLCEDVVHAQRAEASALGIALRLEADVAARVLGDAATLRQLVTNLVSNAVRNTRSGGRVAVRIATEGAQARLEVVDDGVGIPAADLARVFDRFYRVDRARPAGGFGLGLSIAKAIADAHRGTIRIDSTEGQGTRVTVRLPLAEQFVQRDA